jgi:hypothetical protein
MNKNFDLKKSDHFKRIITVYLFKMIHRPAHRSGLKQNIKRQGDKTRND